MSDMAERYQSNTGTLERPTDIHDDWQSRELPANTPVKISTENTSSERPEVAAFHLNSKPLEDYAEKEGGALFHIIKIKDLTKVGRYLEYDGYFFNPSGNENADFLIVSSANDGHENRRSSEDGTTKNFTYQFASKGSRVEFGRTSNPDLTPNLDTISREHLSVEFDDEGTVTLTDHSQNGTTLHATEAQLDALETSPATPSDELEDLEVPARVALENEPDAETRYGAAELLGNRYPVRRSISHMANKARRLVESAIAENINNLDMPEEKIRKNRYLLAERRVSRHQKRVDSASEGSSVQARRAEKLKAVAAKRDRLKSEYNAVTNRMDERTKKVERDFEGRRENYLGELKAKAEAARKRKAIRNELKEQGANYFERRAIVKDVFKSRPDLLDKVAGSTSNIAAFHERNFNKSDKAQLKVEQSIDDITQKIDSNQKLAEHYRLGARQASWKLESLAGDAESERAKLQETIDNYTAGAKNVYEEQLKLNLTLEKFKRKLRSEKGTTAQRHQQLEDSQAAQKREVQAIINNSQRVK